MILFAIKNSDDGNVINHDDISEKDREMLLDCFHRTRCKRFKEMYKEDIIFTYLVRDAWFRFLVSIEVFRNGMVVIQNGDITTESYIDGLYIRSIINIIDKNSDFLCSDDTVLEDNHYTDGQKYDVILSNGKVNYYFDEYNIQCYTRKYPIGYKIKGIVTDIINILRVADVECDNKYVYGWLDKPREEE